MSDPEARRRRNLANAARELLFLAGRWPELFEHILPLSADDMETLRELAFESEEDDDYAAE